MMLETKAILAGVTLTAVVIVGAVACNDTGDTYVYPQDTSHGYYDTHHHYHYYPKYKKGSKSYVVPAPKPNRAPKAPSFSKPSKRK